MRRSVIVVIALCLVACRPPRSYVAVRGVEIVTHLGELQRDGEATVATVVVGPGKAIRAGDAETVFYAQTVRVDGKTTSIEQLAAGCPPGIGEAGLGECELARYHDTPIKLRDVPRELVDRRVRHNKAGPIIAGGLALGSLGAMVYCISECTSDKAAKSMGLGASALVFTFIAYVLGGGKILD